MELQSHVFAGEQRGAHLLITGGVHGDELEPTIAIRKLMDRPELRTLCGKLTLTPVVNEAAVARGQRVAEDGLDLARTCPGNAGGTITERTAHALSRLIRTADYYMDLHTGGAAYSIWPMTGYMLHADARVLAEQRKMARAFNLPVVWGTDGRLEGRSLSVARDANIPAIYAEYLGGGRCSDEGVEAFVTGCLNVLGVLGMLERAAPLKHVELIVEDPRPSSGHMQRCYPAPAAGCFEAAVELGQPIAAGQRLGTIIDPLGRTRLEVCATERGCILALRTLPAVQPGDSLAVILEIPLET